MNDDHEFESDAMLSLTPVLFVERIEPCLDFWSFLGFEKMMEAPQGESGRAG